MHRLATRRRFSGWWMGAVLVVAVLSSGCGSGSPKGDVSGTVTYKGNPVPTGSVTFLDAKNQVVGSSAIMAGRYAVSKVPPSLVKITVTTPPVPTGARPGAPPGLRKALQKEKDIEPSNDREGQPDKKGEGRKEDKPDKKQEGKQDQEETKGKESAEPETSAPPSNHVVVPSKYADPDSSGLAYTVQPGVQVHNLELK